MFVWLTIQLLFKIFAWDSAHLSKITKLCFLVFFSIEVLIEIQNSLRIAFSCNIAIYVLSV